VLEVELGVAMEMEMEMEDLALGVSRVLISVLVLFVIESPVLPLCSV
jgi:hypothetical protein